MTLRTLSYQKLLFSLLISNFLLGDADTDSTDIDLDALWETTVWEEIDEIIEIEGEVQQVVSVAGVRGAEAEDEILTHIYYRKSMKGLTRLQLKIALAKLSNKKNKLLSKDSNHPDIEKINGYITQIKYKLQKI